LGDFERVCEKKEEERFGSIEEIVKWERKNNVNKI
jgi:hypothetical protein